MTMCDQVTVSNYDILLYTASAVTFIKGRVPLPCEAMAHSPKWQYALVWLVACEALLFHSISCTNIPQNLQCAAIYPVKDLLAKHG
jgi:hypothetical protein